VSRTDELSSLGLQRDSKQRSRAESHRHRFPGGQRNGSCRDGPRTGPRRGNAGENARQHSLGPVAITTFDIVGTDDVFLLCYEARPTCPLRRTTSLRVGRVVRAPSCAARDHGSEGDGEEPWRERPCVRAVILAPRRVKGSFTPRFPVSSRTQHTCVEIASRSMCVLLSVCDEVTDYALRPSIIRERPARLKAALRSVGASRP